MAFTGRMVGGDDDQDGSGGPATAFGASNGGFGKTPSAGRVRLTKTVTMPFQKDSAGKLSKSGASTKSESLARLRGKGALA